MKMNITVAFAALITVGASASAFAAPSERGGHYEWRYAPRPGPNKSSLPDYRRVWIADAAQSMAMTKGCGAMSCCKDSSAKT
jgi:hypothetical protein